jgi:hypothetical protein
VGHGRCSRPHPNDPATLRNSFQTNLLLDDEHASQEFDETESAMRAQVGIVEQSVAQKLHKPIANCQTVTTNLSHPVYSVKFSGGQTNCKTVKDLVMWS